MYIYKVKNKMEKVLIITYYWPPSAGSGVHRWLKFSKYLSPKIKDSLASFPPKLILVPTLTTKFDLDRLISCLLRIL